MHLEAPLFSGEAHHRSARIKDVCDALVSQVQIGLSACRKDRTAAATDPKGRLLIGEVDRALEKFDELTRTQVIAVLSSVGTLA
jgi:hypothetical protein